MDETQMRRAIARKRDGEALAAPLWSQIVRAYLAGVIDDAQMGAFLMACVLRGMTFTETVALTEAFVRSGETMTTDDPRTVDKHSTGGVGDSASLIVVPLVAACGVPVAKLSGRALGHTGGTLDKLEAIPGARTDLSVQRFAAIVREVGCAIAAQSDRLVPADKRVYALRDHTATVPAPGLIAASVVAKKIAGGAHGIVYDVKTGNGAFMPDEARACELAHTLVALTASFGRRAIALVSDMNEPLGRAVGTGLEAIEARDFLRGRRDPRLEAVVLALGTAMLRVTGFAGDARAALSRALADGSAHARLESMLAAQGMHGGALAALRAAEPARCIRVTRDGFVAGIDSVMLGECARALAQRYGSGAGIVVGVRLGDRVAAQDLLATAYGVPEDDDVARLLSGAFAIADAPPPVRPLLYVEIDSRTGTDAVAVAANGDAGPRSTLESK